MTNDIFAKNAWYFRNALVRANYNDIKNGIFETTEFLELFLHNLLLNETNLLQNQTLHISGTFKEAKKPDIDPRKPDIGKLFTPKTVAHIIKLKKEFPYPVVFGRSDVIRVLGLKPSMASELLKTMVEKSIIETVSGYGKGKYHFKY